MRTSAQSPEARLQAQREIAHLASCHVVFWYVSRHVTSCRVVSCGVVSCRVMSCRVVSRHLICHVMSRHAISCHAMQWQVTSCHVMKGSPSRSTSAAAAAADPALLRSNAVLGSGQSNAVGTDPPWTAAAEVGRAVSAADGAASLGCNGQPNSSARGGA